MRASPFTNYEEFYSATGPIYTFADRPAIIGILTVLSALIFLYFIYATYAMRKGGDSGASMKGLLGFLLAASVLPLADAAYSQYIQRSDHRPTATQPQETEAADRTGVRPVEPLALLGTLGIGTPFAGRRKRSTRSKARRSTARTAR